MQKANKQHLVGQQPDRSNKQLQNMTVGRACGWSWLELEVWKWGGNVCYLLMMDSSLLEASDSSKQLESTEVFISSLCCTSSVKTVCALDSVSLLAPKWPQAVSQNGWSEGCLHAWPPHTHISPFGHLIARDLAWPMKLRVSHSMWRLYGHLTPLCAGLSIVILSANISTVKFW